MDKYEELKSLIAGCIHHQARSPEDVDNEAQNILDILDGENYAIAYPGEDIIIPRDDILILFGALSTLDFSSSPAITHIINEIGDTIMRTAKI